MVTRWVWRVLLGQLLVAAVAVAQSDGQYRAVVLGEIYSSETTFGTVEPEVGAGCGGCLSVGQVCHNLILMIRDEGYALKAELNVSSGSPFLVLSSGVVLGQTPLGGNIATSYRFREDGEGKGVTAVSGLLDEGRWFVGVCNRGDGRGFGPDMDYSLVVTMFMPTKPRQRASLTSQSAPEPAPTPSSGPVHRERVRRCCQQR